MRRLCGGFLWGIIFSGFVIITAHGQNLAWKKLPGKITSGKPKPGEISLFDLLDRIETNRNVSFAYQKQFLSGKYVDGRAQMDGDIIENLSPVLRDVGLQIRKVDNVAEPIFIIYPNEEHGISNEVSANDKGESVNRVSGNVRSAQGLPLERVSVHVKGKQSGVTSDANGNFVIDGRINLMDTLQFSYVGYDAQEIPLAAYDRFLRVTMREGAHPLTEIVVTALGINRGERALGYAATTLHTDEFTETGNTNVLSALYGKVPGMRIRTAPGGATSAVTTQIRGFNSLNYNTQPLYVIDGVIMRDSNEKGQAGINNDDYFTDARIRGNGVLDISSEDVESITVLKGASAAALYGSDAVGGVIAITTKKGTAAKGVGISAGYQFTTERVASTPRYQNIYGPGFDRARNLAMGADANGWMPVDVNGDGTRDGVRPMFESYAQFGLRMAGQEVYWWDGTRKKYEAHPDNFEDLHRIGQNNLFNLSVSDRGERFAYRVGYTNNLYEGIQVGGRMVRNTLHLNSSYAFNDRISIDLVGYYTNNQVRNRPYKLNRLASSWTGFFGRSEDMRTFFEKYQTSFGYKFVPFDHPERNPAEALTYTTPRGYEVMDFLWQQLRNSEDERHNRWLTSLTLNARLTKELSFRGRFGTDLTREQTETKKYNEYPTAFNGTTSTGAYGRGDANYAFLYGEGLLTYEKDISDLFSMSLRTGFQIRDERYNSTSTFTNGGLVLENWFDLKNSFYPSLDMKSAESSVLKYAWLGIADLTFRDVLYVQATGRQEYSSTLPPKHNSYFYPSLNTAFMLSEAVELPAWINAAKLRASVGMVGNAPPPYEANILYERSTLQTIRGPVTSVGTIGSLYGNENIRSERRTEVEAGAALWFFKGRLGFDLTHYISRTRDQMLRLDLPASVGASKILTNMGVLRNQGWEMSVTGIPARGKLAWSSTLTAAINKTTLESLPEGIRALVFKDLEGGSVQIVAEPGERVGNVYVHPRLADAAGNYIIGADGAYTIDKSTYVKAGNILPLATGGWMNRLNYEGISFDLMIDYSFGGQIVSPALKYGMGSGLYESTLAYRDEAHGGLPYWIDDRGNKVLANGTATGTPIYHDGIILKGVTAEGQPNTTIIDAASYYLKTYDWGDNAWNEEGMIYDNSYIKVRELSIGYEFPGSITQKLRINRLRFALIGRNLFYVWRTLENLDPEATIGTSWLNQGIDEGSEAATRSYGFSVRLGI